MHEISYRYCQFPPFIVQRTVWLYCRVTLSFRDVKVLLAERGITVSYETIRRWVARFGPQIARRLRRLRPRAHPQWHLDEMFVSFGGKNMYLCGTDLIPNQRSAEIWHVLFFFQTENFAVEYSGALQVGDKNSNVMDTDWFGHGIRFISIGDKVPRRNFQISLIEI